VTRARDARQLLRAARAGGESGAAGERVGFAGALRRGTRLVERPVARFPLCGLLAAASVLVWVACHAAAPSGEPRPPCAARRGHGRDRCWPGSGPRVRHAQSDWLAGTPRSTSATGRAPNRSTRAAHAPRAHRPGCHEPCDRAGSARAGRQPGGAAAHASSRSRHASGPDSGLQLGTVLGQRVTPTGAGGVRRSLERDPADVDARWNYELLKQGRMPRSQQPKPQPNAPERGSPDQPQQRPNPQRGRELLAASAASSSRTRLLAAVADPSSPGHAAADDREAG